ncbi:thyrotroph embryonic factor-like [Argopecten irradians]|uniref:thyrotroph embryonic factor-like n=1 Tax=Argopecten irradians TaxID=31199 RepID=UPI003715B6B3
MSFFGVGQQGITLKELLENPELQTAPNLQDGSRKDKGGSGGIDPTSAFLGPNLWNNSNLMDDNFQLEFMGLDEFLSESGIAVDLNDDLPGSESQKSPSQSTQISSQPSSPGNKADTLETLPVDPIEALLSNKDVESSEVEPRGSRLKSLLTGNSIAPADEDASDTPSSPGSVSPPHVPVEFEVDDQDLALASVPGHDFDPKKRKFTVEELKPQPIIKKSRKIYVPDDCKDDKYWNRRNKNNVAAKRSREARRIKENQISMRASFLEKENDTLKRELEKMKKENSKLKTKLSKYESTDGD